MKAHVHVEIPVLGEGDGPTEYELQKYAGCEALRQYELPMRYWDQIRITNVRFIERVPNEHFTVDDALYRIDIEFDEDLLSKTIRRKLGSEICRQPSARMS